MGSASISVKLGNPTSHRSLVDRIKDIVDDEEIKSPYSRSVGISKNTATGLHNYSNFI
jgi:hypothetical protein